MDFQNLRTVLLRVTSQTRPDIVEMREVEALSNLRRRRPRGPSLGRISRRKAAAVSLETQKFRFICASWEQGLGPAQLFWALRFARRIHRIDRADVLAITSDTRPLQYA